MFRWHRIYVDWRTFAFYPLLVILPVTVGYGLVTSTPRPQGWQWLFLVVPFALVPWLWCVAREGIYCNDDGVKVQRILRSDTLRWTEIEEVRDYSGYIGFRTTDGRIVYSSVQSMDSVVTKTISPVLRRRSYDRLIERLRQRHSQAVGILAQE